MNPDSHQNAQPAVPQTYALPANPLWKDLLIPVSIVIAGACVGLGLYLSGGGAAPTGVAGVPTPAAQPADTTDQIAQVTAEDYIKGDLDAPIKIVEFSDFDCPFCSRFHTAMDQVIANNDDVAWVYRHFPLEQLHPQARAVSRAAECVGELAGQDAFWIFTDRYFEIRGNNDGTPHGELIPQLALEAGVTQAPFVECFESERTDSLVQADIDNAIATGGRGTPWSVVIGPTGKTYPVNGALPAAAIEQIIQLARDEG